MAEKLLQQPSTRSFELSVLAYLLLFLCFTSLFCCVPTQVGMVKISMPGMSKLKQDDKKSKKAAAKAKHS